MSMFGMREDFLNDGHPVHSCKSHFILFYIIGNLIRTLVFTRARQKLRGRIPG